MFSRVFYMLRDRWCIWYTCKHTFASKTRARALLVNGVCVYVRRSVRDATEGIARKTARLYESEAATAAAAGALYR